MEFNVTIEWKFSLRVSCVFNFYLSEKFLLHSDLAENDKSSFIHSWYIIYTFCMYFYSYVNLHTLVTLYYYASIKSFAIHNSFFLSATLLFHFNISWQPYQLQWRKNALASKNLTLFLMCLNIIDTVTVKVRNYVKSRFV